MTDKQFERNILKLSTNKDLKQICWIYYVWVWLWDNVRLVHLADFINLFQDKDQTCLHIHVYLNQLFQVFFVFSS